MIFVKYDNDTLEVTFRHYKPFDNKDGMRKSKEELLAEGALVDSIPEAPYIEGKSAMHKYNPQNNTVYVEYIDADKPPINEIEQLKADFEQLKSEKDQLAETLDMVLTDIIPSLQGGI